jgi:ABC-type multidrug transport system fused ATPase/permease subunit
MGRTDSGKSSLTLALLRAIPTEGISLYDGVEIKSINLEALRQNISMIPQAPELMAGTVRQCLDPYAQYDDAALNDALLATGFSGAHSEAGEKITLDFTLANGGSNLSLGQRYVIERD